MHTIINKSVNNMNMAWTLAIIIFVTLFLTTECVSFVKTAEHNKLLQVKTENGIVQGREEKADNGRSFFMYQGIPFAQPPLYNLRFRSPQPVSKWSGVLDATKEASSCIQMPLRPTGINPVGSEDCLYLNVYSPVNPQYQKDLLPVLFWIHGGAFIEGSPDINIYGPQFFLEQNLLIVTANYRVGMFGFLSTEDEACPGNYGLKDQNAVLKWIARNIKKFGGDPDKVTIVGQSAGASSVMYHMVSTMSRGLFHGAIAMSGDALTSWSHQRSPRMIANHVGLNFGVDISNTTAFIEIMRSLDSDVLKYGQVKLLIADLFTIYHNGLIFTPVIEPNHKDAFVTELSYNLLEKGDIAKVPLIIGVTSMEMNIFAPALQLLQPVLLYFDLSPGSIPSRMNIPSFARRRLVGNLIRKRYFVSNAISTAPHEELLQFLSDIFFVMPALKSARLISKYSPVYFYVMTYKGEVIKSIGWPFDPELKGVAHAEDLNYIWKNLISNITVEKDKVFRNRFIQLWSNFVKFGNPTPTVDNYLQNVTWPTITAEDNNNKYLQIGEDLEVLRNYRGEHVQFWDRLYEKYAQRPFHTY